MVEDGQINKLNDKLPNPAQRYSRVFQTVCLALLIALGALGPKIAPLSRAEQMLDDLRIGLFENQIPVQNNDITIITINEDTLRSLKTRSPIPRWFLADLINFIDSAEPKAIGVDILIDQSDNIPGSDQALINQLHDTAAPIVFAWLPYADNQNIISDWQFSYLENFFAATADSSVLRARVDNGLTDYAGVVRTMKLSWPTAGESKPINSFATALATLAGNTPLPQETKGGVSEVLFSGRPAASTSSFTILPAHVLANSNQAVRGALLPLLKNKIVIIGGDMSNVDRHRTAYSLTAAPGQSATAGTIIQAHMTAQIIEGRHRRAPGIWPWIIAGLFVCLGFWCGNADQHARKKFIGFLAITVFITAFTLSLTTLTKNSHVNGFLLPVLSPLLAGSFAFFVGTIVARKKFQTQRNFIKTALRHYVSPDVAKQLEREPERLKLWGESRELTILFADIEGFTSLTEFLAPDRLTDILNQYLEGLTAIVLKYDGTLDKYIGDAIVVFWGAPADEPQQREKAIACALEMVRWARGFSKHWNDQSIPLGSIRVGINTGTAIVGNFGSLSRYNYTAIGDNVNLAARLESANKFFGTSILVSSSVLNVSASNPSGSDPTYAAWRIGHVQVKGKDQAVNCTVFDPNWDDNVAVRDSLRRLWPLSRADNTFISEMEALSFIPQNLSMLYDIKKTRLNKGEYSTPIKLSSK